MATKRMMSTAVIPGAHGAPKPPTTTLDPSVVALLESGEIWYLGAPNAVLRRERQHYQMRILTVTPASRFADNRPEEDAAIARIAACAPELLREALRNEWRLDEAGDYYCETCLGAEPNHEPTCELAALLRKAGSR